MIMAEHPYRVALPFAFANGLQKSVCNFALGIKSNIIDESKIITLFGRIPIDGRQRVCRRQHCGCSL